jgi:hypothetical protein
MSYQRAWHVFARTRSSRPESPSLVGVVLPPEVTTTGTSSVWVGPYAET